MFLTPCIDYDGENLHGLEGGSGIEGAHSPWEAPVKISMVWKGDPGFRVPILHGKLPCLCSRWLPATPAGLISVKPAASFQGRAGLPAHPPPSCPGRDGVLTHHRGAGPFPGSGVLQASAWLPPRAPHVLGFLLTALAVSFPGITPYSNRRSPLIEEWR